MYFDFLNVALKVTHLLGDYSASLHIQNGQTLNASTITSEVQVGLTSYVGAVISIPKSIYVKGNGLRFVLGGDVVDDLEEVIVGFEGQLVIAGKRRIKNLILKSYANCQFVCIFVIKLQIVYLPMVYRMHQLS